MPTSTKRRDLRTVLSRPWLLYTISVPVQNNKNAPVTIRAFGFALSKALVTDGRALLVANETTKQHALEGPVRQISGHLACRDETRQNRCPYAKKLQKDRIPLECADVEQKGPRCIADFANMLTGTHATE
jgi:hypothetical protein